jgi:hypothetical protein
MEHRHEVPNHHEACCNKIAHEPTMMGKVFIFGSIYVRDRKELGMCQVVLGMKFCMIRVSLDDSFL